jgi:Na+-driven multidrug efflux pump
VLEGAFAGAGDTMPAIFLGLPFTLLRVPASIFAGSYLGLGVTGIFWALALTSVVRGLLFAFWFARNRWIHAKA